MSPAIGEIRMFAGNYAPVGWALCDGSLQQISGNETLYTLLGTTHGGDGNQTFGLPDLRGRVPVHNGTGNGLTPIALGQRAGAERVTLLPANLPPHTHVLNAVTVPGTVADPSNMMMAATKADSPAYVTNVKPAVTPEVPNPILPPPVAMQAGSITTFGQNLPVSIMQPYTAINFIIATAGIYPSPN